MNKSLPFVVGVFISIILLGTSLYLFSIPYAASDIKNTNIVLMNDIVRILENNVSNKNNLDQTLNAYSGTVKIIDIKNLEQGTYLGLINLHSQDSSKIDIKINGYKPQMYDNNYFYLPITITDNPNITLSIKNNTSENILIDSFYVASINQNDPILISNRIWEAFLIETDNYYIYPLELLSKGIKSNIELGFVITTNGKIFQNLKFNLQNASVEIPKEAITESMNEPIYIK